MSNVILATDSYKSSHFLQYPPHMDGLFSYFESRGGKYDRTVFFGLQAIIDRYLKTPITQANIDEAEAFFLAHGEPFNRAGWEWILKVHNGYLPIMILAVPEGSVIPTHNVLFSVESTDPECAWLVNYVETFLVRVWYPTTVATLSFFAKKRILEALYQTSDDPQAEINFKLHDFGGRGVSSGESAGLGGAAHLVNFMGSDTVEGVLLANRVYKHPMAAFSIPATEHSTITSWGRENEGKAYENALEKFGKPGALFACVSDSYNLYDAVESLWGAALRDKVIASGATVVIRPDSGVPSEVVTKTLTLLEGRFGSKVNSRGFKVLNHVRVIQGDGITPESIPDILTVAARAGYSATNIAFGMGGGLLQQVNRDTQRFAYKASAIHFADRGWVGINKDPITDPGKASKAGRLALYRDGDVYRTGRYGEGWKDNTIQCLAPAYIKSRWDSTPRFGETQTLDQIRARANAGLDEIVYKHGR
jgi:nicotinamide phosphoribosyltransferase